MGRKTRFDLIYEELELEGKVTILTSEERNEILGGLRSVMEEHNRKEKILQHLSHQAANIVLNQ